MYVPIFMITLRHPHTFRDDFGVFQKEAVIVFDGSYTVHDNDFATIVVYTHVECENANDYRLERQEFDVFLSSSDNNFSLGNATIAKTHKIMQEWIDRHSGGTAELIPSR